ncbi:hypothetical protein DFJ67_1041 [Asanoa ferruginea]|uniref:Uncharacterized protein n=1 Tax=Asanoa ferruginea TaxID=53367 RepID=A0A3D9ZCP5_9ACTN|nr:hypothetical protein [Asanoa ferruginea]REF95091.1 hypothetical protein DFJ67_1041 [Asanoa ferruginea]GIF53021.1 hypothetical protein Afe04nite_75600 [Asanoa ferruginea]
MTTQPEAGPNEQTSANQITKPWRELIALVLVGANAVLLFVGLIDLLVPYSANVGFSSRAGGSFFDFVGIEAIVLPLLAVLLATHLKPAVPRAKLVTQVALAEYAVSAVFGVIALLAWLFGSLVDGEVRAAFTGLLVRIAYAGIFAAASFLIYKIWRTLYYVPRPKAQPGMYGTPGAPGGYPPAGPGPMGQGQQGPGQPGYGAPTAYGQPGYPPPPAYPGSTQSAPPTFGGPASQTSPGATGAPGQPGAYPPPGGSTPTASGPAASTPPAPTASTPPAPAAPAPTAEPATWPPVPGPGASEPAAAQATQTITAPATGAPAPARPIPDPPTAPIPTADGERTQVINPASQQPSAGSAPPPASADNEPTRPDMH